MADMKDFTEIKLFDTSIHHYQIFSYTMFGFGEKDGWKKEGEIRIFFNCLVGGNGMKENKKNSLVLFKDQT
jgi:hypothetical protein